MPNECSLLCCLCVFGGGFWCTLCGIALKGMVHGHRREDKDFGKLLALAPGSTWPPPCHESAAAPFAGPGALFAQC